MEDLEERLRHSLTRWECQHKSMECQIKSMEYKLKSTEYDIKSMGYQSESKLHQLHTKLLQESSFKYIELLKELGSLEIKLIVSQGIIVSIILLLLIAYLS